MKIHIFCIVFLGAFALFIRAPWIGDPIINVDEQFYLLVADRMWHGDLPYVAIWDRKPIGLFLLYAVFRPLSENGIVAYQIAALFFATGTAFFIVRIATRLGHLPPALMAGVLYIVYIPALGGNGGQSPVFYNLFMVIAALTIVKATEVSPDRAIWRHGIIAMILVGLAIQVKYTAFVEGIFFGLWLLWLQWKRHRGIGRIITFAVPLVACALLPTLLALIFFASKGAGWTFIQANFLSIFQANNTVTTSKADFLFWTSVKMAPIVGIAVISSLTTWRSRRIEPWLPFVRLWCLFAFIGFVVIGRFYAHYALPWLVPLVLLVVPLLRQPIAAGLVMGPCLLVAVATIVEPAFAAKGNDHRYIARLTDILTPYTKEGCLYFRDGPPIAYLLTGSCLPTPYVFPEHLTTVLESRAADASESMKKLVAGRPSAIILSDGEPLRQQNPETAAMLKHLIDDHYRFKTSVIEPNGVDHQSIYVRADLK